MTKVTDQAVPPELATAFFRIWSPATAPAPATGTGRTRRAAKLRPQPKKRPANRPKLMDICRAIARAYSVRKRITYQSALARHVYSLARAGTFPEEYWHECLAIGEETLTSAPASVPDPSPPPYAYRDPFNLPTIPTYPPGTPGGSAPEYHGETTAGYFEDNALSWNRTRFAAPANYAGPGPLYACTLAPATLSVSTDRRASRPMFSAALRVRAYSGTGPYATDTTPPHIDGQAQYSRYRPPITPAPFYSGQVTLYPVTLQLVRIAPTDAAALSELILDRSPLPMIGRRYNNNTEVDTEITPTAPPILYLPRLDRPSVPKPLITTTGPLWQNPFTGKKFQPTWFPPAPATTANNGAGFAEWSGPTRKIYGQDGTLLASIPYEIPGPYNATALMPLSSGWLVHYMRTGTHPYGDPVFKLARYSTNGALLSTTDGPPDPAPAAYTSPVIRPFSATFYLYEDGATLRVAAFGNPNRSQSISITTPEHQPIFCAETAFYADTTHRIQRLSSVPANYLDSADPAPPVWKTIATADSAVERIYPTSTGLIYRSASTGWHEIDLDGNEIADAPTSFADSIYLWTADDPYPGEYT